MSAPVSLPGPVASFVAALVEQRFDDLLAVLHPAVAFRALAPGETVRCDSAEGAVAEFRCWFGHERRIELIGSAIEPIVDRVGFGYRLRVHGERDIRLVEQRAFADVDDGRFVLLDVLCSGFRVERLVSAGDRVHRFDAGSLGCGTGLPREFRARIAAIAVGDVLEIVARDPSAHEDLPALARLLGHRVVGVASDRDGTLTVRVERGR